MFPEYFGAGVDDYVRYIKQRAKLNMQLLRSTDAEEKTKLNKQLAKVNNFIYTKDQPFDGDSIKDFDLKFEETCVKLRQHCGNGKDIKEYTVVEYYVLIHTLEKERVKQLNKNK